MSFSTPELINFVLSVVLSGASIFLAIAAIALGKFSEQAMIQRSDESIRLQNEVFLKTTDALQRIESSTGVTEKRIEDIISGRVGDISRKIASIATEKQEAEGGLKPQEIEKMIRRTLLQSLREEGVLGSRGSFESERRRVEADMRRMEEEERRKQEKKAHYEMLHHRLLTAISMRDDVKAIKMGQGNASARGDELFDGLYVRRDGKRIGVIDFASIHRVESVRKATANSLIELQKGAIEHVYMILFEPLKAFEEAFTDSLAAAAPELKSKISLTVCPEDKITEVVAALTI